MTDEITQCPLCENYKNKLSIIENHLKRWHKVENWKGVKWK